MIKQFFLRIKKLLDCKRKKFKVKPATGDPDTEAGGNCIAELKIANEEELLGLEAIFALKKPTGVNSDLGRLYLSTVEFKLMYSSTCAKNVKKSNFLPVFVCFRSPIF